MFVALLVAQVFDKRTGLVNLALHAVFPAWNLDFAWLEEHVMVTLILSALWLYAGFNMVYFLAALQNVPPDLIDAASIDGASRWQRFWHVTLPEIRPIASLVLLLSVSGSFQLFELPFIIFNATGNPGGPNESALTIVMYLYQTGFLVGDLGYASAIGWVLAILLMTVASDSALVRATGGALMRPRAGLRQRSDVAGVADPGLVIPPLLSTGPGSPPPATSSSRTVP